MYQKILYYLLIFSYITLFLIASIIFFTVSFSSNVSVRKCKRLTRCGQLRQIFAKNFKMVRGSKESEKSEKYSPNLKNINKLTERGQYFAVASKW
jgi:hypothetical protein